MSWLLSIIVAGFIYTGSNFPTENFTPQVVVSTPQFALQGDETEKFEQTYPLNANGRISVDNVNGSIIIEAWDKNEVKLEAVKIADSRERLAEVEIKIDAKPDYLRVETEFGRNRNWNCTGYCRLEVQYKLSVPRGAVLNEIETVNGSVTISNMTNFTKASAVNGTVKATNLRGTAEVETVNGTSEVSFDRLDTNSKINLSTVNGRVNLLIPSDADATIKADTVNGSISNEFNLPVRKGKYVGRDLYGKLGDGNVKINLDSVNGGLSIKRQQDGKSPKPVTNLLKMNEDADDEDDEDSVSASAAAAAATSASASSKMNKDIAKAVKESTKVAVVESLKIAEQSQAIAQKALKENAKQIERAQRDAERIARDMEKIYGQAYGVNWSGSAARSIVEKTDSFPVKGIPKVTVDAKNCAVSVRGWDNNEVKYRLTKIIRGAAQKTTDVIVNRSDSEITIFTNTGKKISTVPNPPSDGDEPIPPVPVVNGNSYRIEVFVPKKSNLRILTDREIRVEGVTGSLELNGGDESINVRESEGKLKIIAADALVRVIGFNGEVDSKTEDGANFFEGNFAKFSAHTVDGKIILTLPENADIDIKSESEIQAEGFNLSETDGFHRIGNGGKVFNLKADEGEIFIRNAKNLNAKY